MKNKLGLVQVFRGVAAILVVLCHLSGSTQTWFKTSFAGDFFLRGYIGVDFFFVLSGFIITYVHFKDILNGTNKVAFIRKRFIRIYPIYWIVVSVYVVLLFFTNGKTTHLDHMIDFHSVSDWIYIIGCYLLLPMKSNPLLGVAWSLTYEIIFYVVFFVFILIGFKKAKNIFLLWTFLVLVKIILSSFYTFPNIIIFNERIIEFLTGCFIAYLILKSFFLNKWIWIALFAIGIIFFYIVYPEMLLKPIGILVLSFIMGLIVYKIVIIDISKENKYPKLLLLVGDASYSIYLSHLIFLSVLLRIFEMLISKFHIYNFIALQFIIFILFLIIVTGGVLIYQFIESPLLRFFNRKPRHSGKIFNYSSSL